MWIAIAIVAQLATCVIAVGLLWKDWGGLARKNGRLPAGVLLGATLLATGLSIALVVKSFLDADRLEAGRKGETLQFQSTLSTLLDRVTTVQKQVNNEPLLNQNRELQQEVADTKKLIQSTKEKLGKPLLKTSAVPTVINAPGGIPIVGNQGTVNQPTVNNYGPLPRRLLNQTKSELANCLKKKPGHFSIGALEGNREAYKYAEDWREVLMSAGWQIEHKEIPIQIFVIHGGMWSGMQIRVHDASTVPGQIALAENSPEQNFNECLAGRTDISGGGRIVPYKDSPTWLRQCRNQRSGPISN